MSLVLDSSTEQVVRSALVTMAQAADHSPDYGLEPLARSSGGSWLVRATSPDNEDDLIYHLIVDRELAQNADQELVSVSGPHVARQLCDRIGDFLVVQRPYLAHLFTVDDLIAEMRTLDFDKRWAESYVHSFIDQALSALESIHAAGRVHGDIRPGKFGFTSDRKLLLRDVGTRLAGRYKDSRYVAPELLDGSRKAPSASTDVYAVLQVLGDVLQPFRGDPSSPALAALDARARWLHDYYFPRKDRPSAGDLHTLFITGTFKASSRNTDQFIDAYNSARKKRRRPWRDDTKIGDLGRFLSQYPETNFAVDGSPSGKRLAAWLATSGHIPSDGPGKRSWAPAADEFRRKPRSSGIDDDWLDLLHRNIFGFPRDAAHDERMQDLPAARRQDRELFGAAVEAAEDARDALLRQHDFLSTREAIDALKSATVTLAREEFVVLRRWGFVLAVPDHGRWLYPAFQFRDGYVSRRVLHVHEKLSLQSGGQDPNPWVELTYWSVRRDALNGRCLADVLWQNRMNAPVDTVIANAPI